MNYKIAAGLGLAAIALGTALPAGAELAETYSPDEETVVGGRDVFLPSVPATPRYYALPMEVTIVQDTSVTTDTPITDAYYEDLAVWQEAVIGCLSQSPDMIRTTEGGDVPFMLSQQEGTILLNANGNPVCPL